MNPDPNSEVIRQLLIDIGLAFEVGDHQWIVYSSFMPDRGNKLICIYDTPGTLDGRIMATGEQIAHPGIMIRVCGIGYIETWRKANELALALDKQIRTVVALESADTYIVHNISRTGDVMYLGMETVGDKRQYDFTINAITTITKEN